MYIPYIFYSTINETLSCQAYMLQRIYIYKFIELVNIPVEGIRLLDALCLLLGKRRHARQKTPCLLQWCGLSLVSSAPKKWCLTRWPVYLLTPQGKFRGPPTCTHQAWRRSVNGPRRSRGTNRQTDRQTLLDL